MTNLAGTEHTDPLELLNLSRWHVPDDETADLRLEATTIGGLAAEMELKWGHSPRQQRTYLLGTEDLYALHEWLTKVLDLDE